MTRALAALAVVLLFGASPGPAPTAPGSADAQLAALARAYYDDHFRAAPIDATFAGLHDHDDRLGDFSATAYARTLQTDREYLALLSALDRSKLSPEPAIDAAILQDALNDDLLLNGTLAQWRHDPDQYSQAATGAIYAVVVRDYAPLATRMRYAIAREQQIPRMLDQAKRNITSVDAVTQRIAYDDTSGAVSFFTDSVPPAFLAVKDSALQQQLRSANAAAAKAMKAYAAWIHAIKPRGTFAIGADAYQKRLKYEDELDIPLAGYLAIGQRELARLQRAFVATAKRIDPTHTPLEVYQRISKDHPTPEQLLPAAAGDLVRLRAFIIAHHIITLPPDAKISVVETPPFQRATTEAAFDPPGPLERVDTQTRYNVTPVDPAWSKKQQEEYLELFSNYERPIISAHECYPGHFVNYAIDKHLTLSLIRMLNWNSSFGEGWAHYDEQMMVDEGWGNGDPRVRLAQLEEALLRAARFVVGVKMHTAGMTIPQAVDFFVREGYQPRQVSTAEALRGAGDPMYGYYTIGKLEILKLRSDYKKKMGSAYTLEGFHDALLAHGDPPLPLLRPLLLGDSDDGKVL
ncbi:MAG: DUF885 domain-containing protein [Candidatus Eremiobacteraeota bacterium]|nr:DUF885 domain-containing protein [Candidatus Eremiobacteraeota bacterium]